jgi:hypothetical protein
MRSLRIRVVAADTAVAAIMIAAAKTTLKQVQGRLIITNIMTTNTGNLAIAMNIMTTNIIMNIFMNTVKANAIAMNILMSITIMTNMLWKLIA